MDPVLFDFIMNGGVDFLRIAKRCTPPINSPDCYGPFITNGYTNYAKYSYVSYISNKISLFRKSPSLVAISDQFSGCAMAYYMIDGTECIAHISLEFTSKARDEWNEYILEHYKNITKYLIFRPMRTATRLYNSLFVSKIYPQNGSNIVGLISQDGTKCFAVLTQIVRSPQGVINYNILEWEDMTPYCHKCSDLSTASFRVLNDCLIPKNTAGGSW